MGEIRSTLDIIMEKTKGMTMTAVEKTEFRKKALTGKIKGLVQRFINGMISVPDIRSEIQSERGKDPSQVDELLLEELNGRIEPDGDNEKVFQLCRELLKLDVGFLKTAIAEFQKGTAKERDLRMDDLRKKLAKRGIAGSAVAPNLDRDTGWKTLYENSKAACKSQLSLTPDSRTTASRSTES